MPVLVTDSRSEGRFSCGVATPRDSCATAIGHLLSASDLSIVPPRRLQPPGGVAPWR